MIKYPRVYYIVEKKDLHEDYNVISVLCGLPTSVSKLNPGIIFKRDPLIIFVDFNVVIMTDYGHYYCGFTT